MGNPVSGTLANTIISGPIKYMSNILKKTNKIITVYADDISISSSKKMSKTYLREVFKKAFTQYGLGTNFKIHPKKTKGMSAHKRRATGLVINHNNQITIPRYRYKQLRVKIHKLSLGEPQNISKLKGQLNIAIYNDETGKIKKYLQNFPETVKKYKLIGKDLMEELNIL